MRARAFVFAAMSWKLFMWAPLLVLVLSCSHGTWKLTFSGWAHTHTYTLLCFVSQIHTRTHVRAGMLCAGSVECPPVHGNWSRGEVLTLQGNKQGICSNCMRSSKDSLCACVEAGLNVFLVLIFVVAIVRGGNCVSVRCVCSAVKLWRVKEMGQFLSRLRNVVMIVWAWARVVCCGGFCILKKGWHRRLRWLCLVMSCS